MSQHLLIIDYEQEPRSFWVEGSLLVIADNVELPPRCIVCNGTNHLTTGRARFSLETDRQRRWSDNTDLLGLVLNRLLHGVRTVNYSMCAKHRTVMLLRALCVIVSAIIGVCVVLLGQRMGNGVVVFAGILVAAAGLWWTMCTWPPLRRQRCHNGKLWLKGAGRPYLDHLFGG